MIDTTGWSAMKKLKHSMLRRAFNENRGGEMILLIQWRSAQVRHTAQKDVEALRKFEEKNAGQPRAIRALNLIEEQNGNNVIHKLTAEPERPKTIFERLATVPMNERIIYEYDPLASLIPNTARKQRIQLARPLFDLAASPAISADHYDPMEGAGRDIKTAYAMACEDMMKCGGDLPELATLPEPARPTVKLN